MSLFKKKDELFQRKLRLLVISMNQLLGTTNFWLKSYKGSRLPLEGLSTTKRKLVANLLDSCQKESAEKIDQLSPRQSIRTSM